MTALRLIAGRFGLAFVTLFIVSIIIFAMVEILPGDVASRILGQLATAENLAVLRAQLQLNDPAPERYLNWLVGILQGDLGNTLTNQRPVTEMLGPRLKNTAILSLVAFALYLPLALIPAAIQALNRDTVKDHALSILTLIILSTPDFLLGTILLFGFVVVLPILPAQSLVDHTSTFLEYARAVALPATTLALVMAFYAVRMLRDNLIEVLDAEYIRTAELNGLSRRSVLWRHALPNALIPTLNVTALNFSYLIGGVVIVEKVFSFPGFGRLLIDALLLRDIPLIEITILIAAAVYIVANLAADVISILLNPRLRSS